MWSLSLCWYQYQQEAEWDAMCLLTKLFLLELQSEFRGMRTSVFSTPVGYLYGISRESLGCGKGDTIDGDVSAEIFNPLLPALRWILVSP